jgi:hypothetical protein
MNTIITITNLWRQEIDKAIADHSKDKGMFHFMVEWASDPSDPERAKLFVGARDIYSRIAIRSGMQ